MVELMTAGSDWDPELVGFTTGVGWTVAKAAGFMEINMSPVVPSPKI